MYAQSHEAGSCTWVWLGFGILCRLERVGTFTGVTFPLAPVKPGRVCGIVNSSLISIRF